MTLTWLHISDFHFREGDPYDRDVVLRALVRSVDRFYREGRQPDLIFATGDIAYSGKAAEYALATSFFDDLLKAVHLDRRHLHLIPGNHDIARSAGIGLVRTLSSREEADSYFSPTSYLYHFHAKQAAFLQWYNDYFKGIREIQGKSTCSPVVKVEVKRKTLGIIAINSAFFCQDDDDYGKLWIGRRCLNTALEELQNLDAEFNIALVHHPLEWLHELERANIKASIAKNVDVLLRGHLHESEIEAVASVSGEALHLAAGAAYQTRRWPNRALYCTIEDVHATVFPIRYEDQPEEVWTVDPSLFHSDPGYQRTFQISRLRKKKSSTEERPAEPVHSPAAIPRFRSNIPSRQHTPFVGRDVLIEEICQFLKNLSQEQVVVLHGAPGVGKSELAREYARRQREHYPGGTFFVDLGSDGPPIDLARIGKTASGLSFPSDFTLHDQCLRTLYELGSASTLLIYDNVRSREAIEPWLPPAGLPCHILITTVVEHWPIGWTTFEVPPLSRTDARQLIETLGGRNIAEKYGEQLLALAGGLPVQICPAVATLAYEERRGRIESARLMLVSEATESFRGVFERLESDAQLLLHAAAFLNPQRIVQDELFRHLQEPTGWSDSKLHRVVDACQDLHLLEVRMELRMHQLFASFVLAAPPTHENAAKHKEVRHIQMRRLVELATELANHPANTDLAAAFMGFRSTPDVYADADDEITAGEGEQIGRALYETGQFEEARPWFERAVAAKEQGDIHGRVDHASLGVSLHLIGYCLSSQGQFEEARPWFERAVAAAEQGDIHGRVGHASLRQSLLALIGCLRNMGRDQEATRWEKRTHILDFAGEEPK